MAKEKYQPLSHGARFFLIVLALILLNCNVPVHSHNALQICADFSLPDLPQTDYLQPVYQLAAAVGSKIADLNSWLNSAPSEGTRTFKIVKVESRRAGSSFNWPVKGAISSGFGMRRHPVTKRNSFHNGIDIKARQGTSIQSPSDGVVVSAGHAGLLGRLVKIKTRQGRILYFGHMHRIKCKKGQTVRRGQLIGTVGSSGRATGPHLHFSVVTSGKYINPLKYLSAN